MATTSTDGARPRHRATAPPSGNRGSARAWAGIGLGIAALLVALAAPLLHVLLR